MPGHISAEAAFWASAALVAGLGMFVRGFRELRLRRLIQNTPTARIRSMAMGLVEVVGTVESRSAVVAPFSGRPCAYWEVDVAVQGGRRDAWKVVHREQSGHPFFLRDDTGVALLYPHGAECRLSFGVAEECLGVALPPVYAQYLDDRGLAMRHVWRLGAMRFRERVLEEHQQVYVIGTAMPRSRAVTVGEGEALAATGTDDWSARRLRTTDAEVVATVRKGENEPTFVISQDPEHALTFVTGLKATLFVYGGPLLALAGLAYWLDALSNGRLFR
jgi:hypothetical protein